MSATEKKTLGALIEDPETKYKTRDGLEYFVTLPARYDKNRSYGVAFCISDWGDTAGSDYQSDVLRPYIADAYDLLTVGVRYHNDVRVNGNYQMDLLGIGRFLGVDGELLAQDTGNLEGILNRIFELMASRGIKSLPALLAAKTGAFHGYSSFGFLPALDHLAVLHDLDKHYKVDRKNIIAFGSSYGGYIASLLGKYAPFTFSLIIDNSGFCLINLNEIFGEGIGRASGAFARSINEQRYEIPFAAGTLWSVDETAEYYFSDAHRQIRSLLIEGHRTASPTAYCCYHSVEDGLVPVWQKDKLCKILAMYNRVYYKRIEAEDVDGKLFKNLSHGMGASLKGIFALSMEKYREMQPDRDEAIDFDRDVTYGFPCGDKLYKFSYTKAGLDVTIEPLYV